MAQKKAKEQDYTNVPTIKVTDDVKTEKYEVFMLVTQNGVTHIAIDRYIMSRQSFDTIEAAKAYVDSKPYELIINAACCLMELSNNVKK